MKRSLAMDKFTKVMSAVIPTFIIIFFIINYDISFYVLNTLYLNIAPMLTFFFTTGLLMAMLSFRRDKRSTLIGIFLPVIFLIFVAIYKYNLLLTHRVFNIHLQNPIENVPLDFGLIGFVLIFINGFLLSHILIRRNTDKIERLLLSIGLGFGTTSLIMLLLGILWEISILMIILPQTMLLIITSVIVLHKGFKVNLKNHLKLASKKHDNITKANLINTIVVTMVGIYTIIAIFEAITYPPIEWDSLAYGVNYAKIIFENKKVPLIAGPSIGLEMSASYPPAVPLLAVYFYSLAGKVNDFYYRILQPIFGIAVMLTTYKLAITISRNKTVSLFAILTLSIIPIYWLFFILESYLMFLTLMLTLSVYFFYKAHDSANSNNVTNYEIIGTLFCGFSALTNYMGLAALGIMVLYMLNRSIRVKHFIKLLALASFIILPWYTRNLILLRNPVYPLFSFGNYLDPILESSKMQHFQSYLNDSSLGLFSIICKLGAPILLSIIIYLNFAKRKSFVTILTLFLFFISIAIMAFHIPFSRYLELVLPTFSATFSVIIFSFLKRQDWIEKGVAIIFISLVCISSVNILSYLDAAKPMYLASDEWDYLIQVYEDADAWKWINENTPQNATIATYDIREYYIRRKIMRLDGYNAAPIYRMDNIEDVINYLKQQNVTHILSVTWAAPMDTRMPPAYKWCILTRYFGEPKYLPAVFVGQKGAAVYHVGPLQEEALYERFSQENLVPPLKHLEINVTVTNQVNLSTGRFYIPIPLDYREGLMVASTNTYGHLVKIELRRGIIPVNTTNWQESFPLVKLWPPQSINTNGVENPSFVWDVDTAGHLTFLVLAEEQYRKNFNITVNIDFYNYWDKNTLFVKEGLQTYNITITNNTFPLIKSLYIQVNEPSILNINSTTYGKRISLQICRDFVPTGAITNLSEQYEVIIRQPTNENRGKVNPTIDNMFLSNGKYTILIVYRDSIIEQNFILLEVELTTLK